MQKKLSTTKYENLTNPRKLSFQLTGEYLLLLAFGNKGLSRNLLINVAR